MNYSIIDYVYKHAADWGVDPEATGRQLKQLRRQNNFTQKDLSELFDYCYDTTATREYISIVESGKQVPSIHFLVFLCELYGCSLDELVVSYRRSRESEDRDQPVPLENTYFIYIKTNVCNSICSSFFVDLEFTRWFYRMIIIKA